ncbi:cobalamin biosynthesis protein CobQ [Sulfitobacter sp. JB4-11]|uniref:cobalamin biosynthesis protein CobQ n=1 Tax=Sulfitobacter rhodophyticola TaxID=3238304 RepID=UPI0035153C27
MNTPAHLLIGAAAVLHVRRGADDAAPQHLVWAALIGALLPDLSLYLLSGAALVIYDIPAEVVFNELYFSQAWQQIFAIDNSFIIWGVLFAAAIWFRRGWAVALTGAALLHLALDFPLHHDDGRPHFWPLSGWVFESPVSYWDRHQGANLIAPVEAFACVMAAILLWRRRPGVVLSVLVAVLLIVEINVARTWLFVFQDS